MYKDKLLNHKGKLIVRVIYRLMRHGLSELHAEPKMNCGNQIINQHKNVEMQFKKLKAPTMSMQALVALKY